MNIISERLGKDDRHFVLVEEQGELLRDLYTYFPKLMKYLWESPKIVALIIQNTKNEDVKDYLAPLFSNNFYENILSSSYIEDNLMYLLTLLIDGEIQKLTNINQIQDFLEESPCGCLLGELRKKNDIQAFFKAIISDSLDNLENNHSSLKINLNVKEIYDEFKEKLEKSGKDIRKYEEQGFLKIKTERQLSDSLSLDDDNEKRNKKQILIEQENFNQKYVPPLDKKALQAKKDELKDNKKMQDFLYLKLNDCDDNENLYSNHKLMGGLYELGFSPQLLLIYQKSFMVIVNFIDSILDKIINNSHKMPYSVKCLSKIILLLIKKKFPSLTETEKNAFISKFFFEKLFIPILKNPAIEALINNLIISGNTLKNLEIISNIIKKFTSGNFYLESESEYTSFNWYFIEKMEKLFEIFDNITKVTLPPIIAKFINGELASDYEYDYFKENQDQVIIHRSMCFNLDQIRILLQTMDAYKDKIFINPQTDGLKKTVEKLLYQNNQDILKGILKSEMKINNSAQLKKSRRGKNDNIPEQKPKVHYFLISSIIYNEKYEKLFNIKQDTTSFSIKELKVSGDEESYINQNNIIRVKNFFCSLLYNYNYLLKTDFNEAKIETTEEILKELLKSSNSVMDGSIPSEWYVTSLLEYLKKIPEDLTKNDCEKLYNEIEDDLRKSIKELDLEALSVIMEKLKYAKRGKNYYEESKRLLNDINLNEETKNIIEKEFIPVEIKFSYDEEQIHQEFEIIPSKLKEKNRDKTQEIEKKSNIRLCTTIDEFTKKFPNLIKYEELQDVNIFELQEQLSFPAKINNYLKIVRQNLEKKGKNDLDLILEKIYDYVMIKLYDKIYPIEPSEQDNGIFQQSIKLSWTEPKHYLGKKKYVFGSFIKDTTKYFNLMNLEKSPKKKVLHMTKIFDSILLILQFNGKTNDIGVDDQMPILNYAVIKAQPFRLYSDAKFMDLYIGSERNKFKGNLLTQFLGICDLIPKIDHTKLYYVEKEEYMKKCNEAIING